METLKCHAHYTTIHLRLYLAGCISASCNMALLKGDYESRSNGMQCNESGGAMWCGRAKAKWKQGRPSWLLFRVQKVGDGMRSLLTVEPRSEFLHLAARRLNFEAAKSLQTRSESPQLVPKIFRRKEWRMNLLSSAAPVLRDGTGRFHRKFVTFKPFDVVH